MHYKWMGLPYCGRSVDTVNQTKDEAKVTCPHCKRVLDRVNRKGGSLPVAITRHLP